jgi:hypothetical protein
MVVREFNSSQIMFTVTMMLARHSGIGNSLCSLLELASDFPE